MNKTILEVSNVTKKVTSPEGELTIVNDISLSLEEGVFASILGPSGSGKTTLLAIMAGLDLPSSGSVKLLDKEITSLNEDKRAQIRSKDVGFVFQSFHIAGLGVSVVCVCHTSVVCSHSPGGITIPSYLSSL